MRRAVVLLLVLAAGAAQAFTADVTHVSDGDTVWVKRDGRAPFKLRLDGLDAPERCQAGGAAARDALAARLLHRRVAVRTRAHDDYGRAVGTLQLDGADVGAWLVSQGLAWNARFGRRAGPYAEEEQQARRAARGVFAQPAPEYPRDFRRRHGPCG
ncbi:thermonuclease family protein [Piscinibacter defluvii]|uniref:thermonuclease family protein n=1 Tax=Piscinibacter defluvii TaxID=1796922 RepID=UPI000FDD7AB5|nr:thermonuclease family protein [Piscinibacter defluvii]